MDSMLTKKILWFAIGAGLGALTGYVVGELVAYKVLKDEAERQAGLEALDERASDYKSDEPEFTIDGQDPAKIVYTDGDTVISKPRKNGTTDYTKFGHLKDKPSLSELASSIRDPQPEQPVEEEKPVPYIISADQYADLPNYDKECITYYENDTTYADSQEQIIDDPVKMLGPNVHLHFGEQSDDPDIVYIRNDAISSDFEVTRVRKSYNTSVAGGEPGKPEKPPRRGDRNRGRRTVSRHDSHEEE